MQSITIGAKKPSDICTVVKMVQQQEAEPASAGPVITWPQSKNMQACVLFLHKLRNPNTGTTSSKNVLHIH